MPIGIPEEEDLRKAAKSAVCKMNIMVCGKHYIS